jgi:hypothetical protein
MSLENMPDASLSLYYENIRKQAEADRVYKHHFTSSPTIRQYAEKLREEMTRRRLQHSPIEWPS